VRRAVVLGPVLAPVLAAGAALLATACNGGSDDADTAREPRTADADAGPPRSVHGERCVDCHDAIVDAWNATPMASALGPIGAAEARELAALDPVTDAAGFEYRFALEDGEPALVERAPWGEETRGRLAFAIGAGTMDRSYAVVQGERMWFAPLERISASKSGAAHAALAPGSSMNPGARLSVPITAECLGCHTDRVPADAWPLNLAPERLDGWTPHGLSCATCHAPVDAHADWHEADLAGEDTSALGPEDPMLRHAEFDRFTQLSVCAACHLQGDVRIALNGDLGPPDPGTDLFDARAIFVGREPTNEVAFVSHVERLMLSDCFTASEMTCTSCHDPHRAVDAPGVRERTRNACLDCHARVELASGAPHPPQGQGERDCVDCHMRKTPTFDVAEVEIHDHWIRAEPGPPSAPTPPAELRAMESPDGRWVRARWPDKGDARDDPGLLMMALVKANLFERAVALVDVAPGPEARELASYHHVRASLLEAAERPEHARAAYERALELDAAFAPSSSNLALLEGKLGDPAAGVARLDAVLARHPLYEAGLRNRAVLRRTLGDVRGTVDDLERAFAVTPSATVAAALSDLYGQLGERERSAEYAALAMRLDPR